MNNHPTATQPMPQRFSSQQSQFATQKLIGLLLALLLVQGCWGGDAETTAPDPLAPFRAAMKEGAQLQLDQLGPVPIYHLDIAYDAEESNLKGTAEIIVPNNSPDPWSRIYFRLYPNFNHYGGGMTVQNVQVHGDGIPFEYDAEGTAIRVSLSEPLLSGNSLPFTIVWTLSIPTWPDSSSTYALFGTSQSMTTLPLFYPSLAVYQPSTMPGTGTWWLDMGSPRGDVAFNQIALFTVTAQLPADVVPVTSGSLIAKTAISPTQTEYQWATGPAREFFLQYSPRFSFDSIETYGTRITSYWLPEDEAAGRAALRYGVAALRIYSDFFGEYPFREMAIAPGPLAYRGMEYPNVSQIGVELYNRSRDNLEILVAHEVAHQWWYQLVHNDPVNEPWLDEALAEYSVKVYLQHLSGNSEANNLEVQRWLAPVTLLKSRGGDEVLYRSVNDYSDFGQYETIVYGKGALFYDELHTALGDREFYKFLQNWLNDHRYKIVNTQDWLTAVEKLGKPELVQMYREWVGSPKVATQEGVSQSPPNAP